MSTPFLKTIDLLLEEYSEKDFKIDTEAQENDTEPWVIATGGNSVPFVSRNGKKYLLIWNPKLRQNAYLEVESDVIITDDEFNKGN